MRSGDRSKAIRPMAPAMGERDVLEDSRLVKQVRELRRLVPACREPCGLGELFREAASYIEDLQVQVKVMQMLLDKLSDE
ncbi:transcription factor UPBEAT1-like [Phragmites australis]|uniref:transcription factor UPBEAT1-like n=1 Tax=Phragmites australis TaxID=29695 RepID=UPI002D779FB1|nr:transcription factor UPBEAT1-like [Phragmites australis]